MARTGKELFQTLVIMDEEVMNQHLRRMAQGLS